MAPAPASHARWAPVGEVCGWALPGDWGRLAESLGERRAEAAAAILRERRAAEERISKMVAESAALGVLSAALARKAATAAEEESARAELAKRFVQSAALLPGALAGEWAEAVSRKGRDCVKICAWCGESSPNAAAAEAHRAAHARAGLEGARRAETASREELSAIWSGGAARLYAAFRAGLAEEAGRQKTMTMEAAAWAKLLSRGPPQGVAEGRVKRKRAGSEIAAGAGIENVSGRCAANAALQLAASVGLFPGLLRETCPRGRREFAERVFDPAAGYAGSGPAVAA